MLEFLKNRIVFLIPAAEDWSGIVTTLKNWKNVSSDLIEYLKWGQVIDFNWRQKSYELHWKLFFYDPGSYFSVFIQNVSGRQHAQVQFICSALLLCRSGKTIVVKSWAQSKSPTCTKNQFCWLSTTQMGTYCYRGNVMV